jgi:ABC-type hemin transport system ATPase subunit
VKAYAVVCVHPNGHRTVLQRMVSSDRAAVERMCNKRNVHPNSVALGLEHTVAEVAQTGQRPSLAAEVPWVETDAQHPSGQR